MIKNVLVLCALACLLNSVFAAVVPQHQNVVKTKSARITEIGNKIRKLSNSNADPSQFLLQAQQIQQLQQNGLSALTQGVNQPMISASSPMLQTIPIASAAQQNQMLGQRVNTIVPTIQQAQAARPTTTLQQTVPVVNTVKPVQTVPAFTTTVNKPNTVQFVPPAPVQTQTVKQQVLTPTQIIQQQQQLQQQQLQQQINQQQQQLAQIQQQQQQMQQQQQQTAKMTVPTILPSTVQQTVQVPVQTQQTQQQVVQPQQQVQTQTQQFTQPQQTQQVTQQFTQPQQTQQFTQPQQTQQVQQPTQQFVQQTVQQTAQPSQANMDLQQTIKNFIQQQQQQQTVQPQTQQVQQVQQQQPVNTQMNTQFQQQQNVNQQTRPMQQFVGPTTTTSTQNKINPVVLDANNIKNQIANANLNNQQLPSNGADVETLCQNRMNNERLPHPQNPSQFIICHPFGSIIMECPNHTVYNAALDKCDSSSNRKLTSICQTNPCQNGGTCTELSSRQFQCTCPSGFTGATCDVPDVCSQNSCGPNGVCIPMQLGSPVQFYCSCFQNKALGISCDKSSEPNPCLGPHDTDLHFPTRLGKNMYIQCEGDRPHLKFCSAPLIFHVDQQQCDWETA